MPDDPLPADVVARLRSDPTAALAAALIVAGSFPGIAAWALAAFGPNVSPPPLRSGPASRAAAKGNSANGAHGSLRKSAAAKADQALLAIMRANPGAPLSTLIKLNRRPRNTVMGSLERLEAQGLVEHPSKGVYAPVDPDLIEAPSPKPTDWVAPLSGRHVARHAADGRVREEVAMAPAPHEA